jgi:hypothetical protein
MPSPVTTTLLAVIETTPDINGMAEKEKGRAPFSEGGLDGLS